MSLRSVDFKVLLAPTSAMRESMFRLKSTSVKMVLPPGYQKETRSTAIIGMAISPPTWKVMCMEP